MLGDIVCFDSKDHSDKSDATHPKKTIIPIRQQPNDFDDVDTNFLVALVELYILTSSLPMVILSVAHVDNCDKYSLLLQSLSPIVQQSNGHYLLCLPSRGNIVKNLSQTCQNQTGCRIP